MVKRESHAARAVREAWRHGSFCCVVRGWGLPCPAVCGLCVGWDAVRCEGPVVCGGLAGEAAHVEVTGFEECGAGVAKV